MNRISRWSASVPMRHHAWYDRDKELTLLETWFKMDPQRPVAFTGPKGCGKTSLFVEAAARAQRKLIRVNGHRDMTAQDLVGSWVIQQDKSMAWLEGPVPAAMQCGAILLIDEFDRIPSGSLSVLQAVLEGAPLTVPEIGETIHPQPGFAIAACCNSIGDASGGYTATVAVDEATLDRFELVIRIDLPSEQEIKNIIKLHVPTIKPDVLNRVVAFHMGLINAAAHDALREAPSLRRAIAMARWLNAGMPADRAVQACYTDRLHASEKVSALAYATRIFGCAAESPSEPPAADSAPSMIIP